MKEFLKTFSGNVNWYQIMIGTAGLLFGTLVYLVDQSPHQIYFVYKSSTDISFYNILPNLFSPIGNNLPTFIYVFSFILIMAVLISCQKRCYLIIFMSWFHVDCAFELGQKFKSFAVRIIPDCFAGISILENTENYFIQGFFDYLNRRL